MLMFQDVNSTANIQVTVIHSDLKVTLLMRHLGMFTDEDFVK